MTTGLPFTLLKVSLVSLLLLTPPVSDAIEQREPIRAAENGELAQIISEGWRKGTIDAAYLLNKNLSSTSIHVEVSKQVATLSGSVNSEINKSLAQEIALSVEGIQKVNNKLKVIATRSNTVMPAATILHSKTDILLTAKVNQKLITHQHLDSALIEVHTLDGRVELSGNTSSHSAKDLAYYLTKNVSGVKSVDNKIKVRTNL